MAARTIRKINFKPDAVVSWIDSRCVAHRDDRNRFTHFTIMQRRVQAADASVKPFSDKPPADLSRIGKPLTTSERRYSNRIPQARPLCSMVETDVPAAFHAYLTER
jgi:phage terminase large subunit-like protein